ncbi:MAG: amidohydrolase family protein [Acidobacteriota bacterium]|nr:amidohydrolase family protein [Acidobacteriota bacterium]
MDLIVRNGTLVSVGGRAEADIGIEDGKIVQLGGAMTSAVELDADGLVVTPGGVDPHVHLTPPTRRVGGWSWADDFESGTRAALAGGVTTVGNISFPEQGETLADAIETDDAEAQRLALSDYFLHPVLMEPDEANLASIEPLHARGHTSIKIFLSFARFDRHVEAYLDAMRKVGEAGGVALVHCEDAAIIDCCCNLLREAGKTDPRFYPEGRPVQAEVVATQRAVGFAETTGCPTYVVHLASSRALEACHDGRRRGVPVYVETRPIYLHLTRSRFEEPDGAKCAGAPPLREQADVDAMWAALRFGGVDTLATDHAPWTRAEKLDPATDATNLRQGVSDLETCLPMLYSAGVRSSRLSLEQFVAVTSTNPSKLFGLYPRKGTIEVGSDADLVVWDCEETRTIDGASMHSRSDYSPYDGWQVTGWPRWTISGGEVVVDRGEISAEPGRGRLIPRGPHRGI